MLFQARTLETMSLHEVSQVHTLTRSLTSFRDDTNNFRAVPLLRTNFSLLISSIFGGADWIACSELEHELIVRTVNSTHPGNATHVNIPDVDHLIIQNPDWKTAHKNFSDVAYRNTHFHQGFANITVQWMKSVMKN